MAPRDPRDTLRRLMSLGSAITGVRREDVEELVRDLVSFEGERMERVEELAEEVFARSRRSVERVGGLLRSELQRELDTRGLGQPGELVDRVVGLLGDLLGTRRRAQREDVAPPASPVMMDKQLPAKKAAAKKAPAKKAAAKKAAARSPAKSTKAAAGSGGSKKAPGKAAPAKKVAAKRAAATDKAGGRAGPRLGGA